MAHCRVSAACQTITSDISPENRKDLRECSLCVFVCFCTQKVGIKNI